ncbi:MAG: hypothetical protein ABI175_10540 [Polyangiales bacterium]
MRLRVSVFAVLGAAVAMTAAAACSTSVKSAAEEGRDEFSGEVRDIEIKHEPCEPNGKSVKSYKADDPLSSAKAYVTHVFEGSKEVCWLADLNGDGRVDVYTYFGDDGLIRRREAAYSIEKAIDEIALYKGGQLEVVTRDTSFDGLLDTWDYYQTGKLVRRERDKNGDARIDEWWTFQPNSDNVVIIQADPRTGKPDPSQKLEINVAFGGPSSAGGGGGGSATASTAANADAGPAPTSTAMPPAVPPPTVTDAGTTDTGKKDAK